MLVYRWRCDGCYPNYSSLKNLPLKTWGPPTNLIEGTRAKDVNDTLIFSCVVVFGVVLLKVMYGPDSGFSICPCSAPAEYATIIYNSSGMYQAM